ncbi:MAG: hypothetical protein QNJ12_03920 [Ilumatobacter sp.]|uniref:hypothetical protein n=1 Tax=Ilumatobacter sp. TaxID=1967498 RepID=UPI00260AE8B3|nr:hypothetical protein [Ilumatobacter sp.]MDJ0767910.1 hypothetical protein [Ilumatobacter sp.]
MDLIAQRLRTLLIVLVLAGLTTFMFSLDRESSESRDRLDEVLASPTATLLRIKAHQSEVSIAPQLPRAMASFADVHASFALSQPVDATHERLGRSRSAVLWRVSDLSAVFGSGTYHCDAALASVAGARRLGLADGVGQLRAQGVPISIAGARPVPESLSFLDQSVLQPACPSAQDDLEFKELVIVVEEPTDVSWALETALGFFSIEDRAKLSVESRIEQIELSVDVANEAARSAARLSLLTAGGITGLVVLLFSAVVVQRRRDYGRRRALGASGLYVGGLVTAQACIAMTISILIAVAASVGLAIAQDAAVPDGQYVAGATAMLLCGAAVGGLVPALLAVGGDPLRELRVP